MPLLLAALLLAGCAAAPPVVPHTAPPADTVRADWGRFFEDEGARGTIVVFDASTGRMHHYDPSRAAQPFIPASTFKVYNSLAALETGVVPDVDSVFVWDGQVRDIEAWNQDHSLRTGIAVSAVWVYQEVARRIGEDGYRAMFALEPYGNSDFRGAIDYFWLNGPLRISADEQVAFLDRLRRGDLAFRPEHQAAVREIILLEEGGDYRLFGKTGWTSTFGGQFVTDYSSGPDIGWFVGWVETPQGPWVFALNLEADPASDLPFDMLSARLDITYAVLDDLGLRKADGGP